MNNTNTLTHYQTNLLKVICIFIIIIHHWAQAILLDNFYFLRSIGGHCCGIFYFLSGYGLYSSFIKDNQKWINNFFSYRIKKIFVPFIIANILYIIYQYYLNTPQNIISTIEYICGIKLINGHFWFLQALLLLYISSYFAFKFSKSNFKSLIAIVLVGNIIFILFHNLASIITLTYPLGIIYKRYEHIIAKRIRVNALFFICALLFLITYYLLFYQNILMKFLFFPNILMFVYLILCLRQIMHKDYKIIDYIASYTFYLYMMNAFSIYFFYYINNKIPYEFINFFLYIAFNLLIAMYFKKICDCILYYKRK